MHLKQSGGAYMILIPEPSVCVCILAHNEEKNIRKTLAAICATKEAETIPIYVYANGCGDGTVEEVMADKGKVRVSVSLFGRPTSVELDYLQLKGY